MFNETNKTWKVDLDNLSLQINCIWPWYGTYPSNLGWTIDLAPYNIYSELLL